jgi:hypothetical protein
MGKPSELFTMIVVDDRLNYHRMPDDGDSLAFGDENDDILE